MGLKLMKDNHGEYRRIWYATMHVNGTARLTSRRLKTPLRGKIPLDENGRFSLNLTGDAAFEKSKAAATAELKAVLDTAREMKAEERNSPGYAESEAYRKLMGRSIENYRIADLAELNASRRPKHILTSDKRKCRYGLSVYKILEHFAKWCARYSNGKPRAQKCVKLTDIRRSVVSAYFSEIYEVQSRSTFLKYVFLLASTYRYYMPTAVENPFKKEYEESYKKITKANVGVNSIVHEAPSETQMRQIWEYARNDRSKPYLYRLAVVAACTGMRIGDCCNLTWDKVDLLNYLITTSTSKTGKPIAVPIFDYVQNSKDYDEILGELRRELEAAITEREGGEKYVIPEAAAIYKRDPSRINKIGKMLFARALFSAPEPEKAVIVGEEPKKKSPAKILRTIESANIKPEKKSRLIRTYELFSHGKSYRQIADAIGNRKGNVSDDLSIIEDMTGERLRPGNPYMGVNAKPSLKTLLKKTRRERTQGQRAGCLYGWHSCRVFFVVKAINAGLKPEVLMDIVGHASVQMVLHYYNPKEFTAAEKMREQFRRNRIERATLQASQQKSALPMADALADARRAILESTSMTPEAKGKAVAALIMLSSSGK
ncbi:MAG: site-specific integrase [Kiritimatiellae bacterium]|nr:site-specific integrase [Kiritimatiellia bacterium]